MIDSDAMPPARPDPSQAVCQAPAGNVGEAAVPVEAIHGPIMPLTFQRQSVSVLVGGHE